MRTEMGGCGASLQGVNTTIYREYQESRELLGIGEFPITYNPGNLIRRKLHVQY